MSIHTDEIVKINCDINSPIELVGEMSNIIDISSDISPIETINSEISNIQELVGSFFLNPIIQVDGIEIPKTIGGDPYDGAYVITPAVNEQILDTDKKILKKDMIIEEIPTYWTSNQTGMTFIIGE